MTLYEMATGTIPFKGSTTAALFDAILHQAPLPLSSMKPGLPPEIGRIIERALEKDRASRYQTASQMQTDLKRLTEHPDGPGIVNLSLFRTMAVSERVKMEFKIEAFSFTKTPHFNNSSANVSNMVLNADGGIRGLGNFMSVTSANIMGGQEPGYECQFRFEVRFSFEVRYRWGRLPSAPAAFLFGGLLIGRALGHYARNS